MRRDYDVRIDRVWVEARRIVEDFGNRRWAIRALTGIDLDEIPATGIDYIIGMATAVALQQCVEYGLIVLNVSSPAVSWFFALPKGTLVSARTRHRIAGQDTSERAAHTAEYSWAQGVLHEIDCEASLWWYLG